MFQFIFADIVRNRIGVILLVLLVAAATALGVAVTLQERALRLGSARAAAPFDLVIGAPGSETQLVLSSVFLQPAPLPLVKPEVLSALRTDPRVEAAVPVGFGDFVDSYPIIGTTSEAITMFGGLSEGSGFDHFGDAVAGADVVREVGTTFRPFHGDAGTVGEVHAHMQYRITGRLARTGTPWDRAILVPIQAVWDVHSDHHHGEAEHSGHAADTHVHDDHDHDNHDDHEHEDDTASRPVDETKLAANDNPGVPAIVVKPKTIADAYRLRLDYRADNKTLAVFPAEVLTRLYSTLGDARQVLALVAAGAQALVGAAILMVIATHVLQRRRQIGALRAFGAPRTVVLAIVWTEVTLVLGAGVLFGHGLGYFAAEFISDHLSNTAGINLPVEFRREDLLGLAATFLIATLATLLPAWAGCRQSPAEALRA